jgi:ribosome recycling factor
MANKVAPFDLADVKRRMAAAVSVLKTELSGLRTGRASPNMLDPITVEAYGSPMPLNQVATVSVPEARMLSVQVWDNGVVKSVEKAIRDADLGLNPQTEGNVIRLRIPELNQERRQELAKIAHKYAEAARVAVRGVRRSGIDHLKDLKKDGHVSEDEIKRHEGDVQKATDSTIGEIDGALAAKEKEIMSV